MKYKAYRDKTASEKDMDRWSAKGRPRLVWSSSKKGTLFNTQENLEEIQKASQPFQCKTFIDRIGAPLHKRKQILKEHTNLN